MTFYINEPTRIESRLRQLSLSVLTLILSHTFNPYPDEKVEMGVPTFIPAHRTSQLSHPLSNHPLHRRISAIKRSFHNNSTVLVEMSDRTAEASMAWHRHLSLSYMIRLYSF
jgi:hypothetical protein